MDLERITADFWQELRGKSPELPAHLPVFEPRPSAGLGEETSWYYDPSSDKIFYFEGDLWSHELAEWFTAHELVHRARHLRGVASDDEVIEEIDADALTLEIFTESRVGWLWALVRWGDLNEEELACLYEATRDNPLWGQGST